MIRLLLAALFLSLAGAGAVHADTRDVYTIRGIAVDETAATVIEARERAMSSARLTAARTLINKITLASDRAAAGGVPVDAALASRFAAAVDVEEEAQGAGRYRGKLAVVLNPSVVRAHLDSLTVTLDPRASCELLSVDPRWGQANEWTLLAPQVSEQLACAVASQAPIRQTTIFEL